MWLVAFVDPNCNNCGKDIKPEWDKAAKRLSGKVKMGKVFSKNLARKYAVDTFPTIGYFPKGEKNYFDVFHGDIIANNIVQWAMMLYKEKTNTEWLPNDRELFLAVNYNNLTSVKRALNKGGNPNFIHPKFGWTTIHHAAKEGYTEVIKALLSTNNANPNIKDKFGKTPIQQAAKNGHKEIVELLSSLRQ